MLDLLFPADVFTVAGFPGCRGGGPDTLTLLLPSTDFFVAGGGWSFAGGGWSFCAAGGGWSLGGGGGRNGTGGLERTGSAAADDGLII